MRVDVIIPVTTKSISRGVPLAVEYFVSRGILVNLAFNGCYLEEYHQAAQALIAKYTSPYGARLPIVTWYAGNVGNPYIARNLVLSSLLSTDAAILMDDDTCPVDDTYMSVIEKYATRDVLIAGRTTTKIPYGSQHFDMLRGGFECYDGFTAPDHTVGCNMVIGMDAYAKLGPMRDDVVSGGDALYGLDYKRMGGTVLAVPELHAAKAIYGMTLEGIIRKQLTRALCFPPEMTPDVDEVVRLLSTDLKAAGSIMSHDEGRWRKEYPEFIDKVFKIVMRLGQMAHHLDKPWK